jgi:hypothetical protein
VALRPEAPSDSGHGRQVGAARGEVAEVELRQKGEGDYDEGVVRRWLVCEDFKKKKQLQVATGVAMVEEVGAQLVMSGAS